MQRNRQRYTMHAVTLPGLGGTARWPVAADAQGTPLMEHCAAEIARYIREKRLRNVVIVGHSFGAAVALKTVLDHPASAAKLFLVDWGAVHPATLTITLEERLQQATARRNATLQQTDEAFRQQMIEMPATAIANVARVPAYAAMFSKIDRLTSAQISYELRRYDWRARLGELTIPVAAVFGLPDGDEAEAAKQEADVVLPGVRKRQLHFLPKTGHWVMEERPQEFDRALRDFLSQQSQKTRSKKP
jgi:pimeloyl-ACP methyl ester carboxylesterase